jgi:hypothetical protein
MGLDFDFGRRSLLRSLAAFRAASMMNLIEVKILEHSLNDVRTLKRRS